MSKLEVDTIDTTSGGSGTLTIGSDNNTTITTTKTVTGNFKDIQWQSVITADGSTSTTAEAGKGYFIDTTSAAHTINLPASPNAGDTVSVVDYGGNFGTNNLTVGRNGSNMQGEASDAIISVNRRATTFVYIDSTKGWIPVNDNTTENYGTVHLAATGGTETTSGDYKIHSFTSSGCFVVSEAGNQSTTVEYLVIAGGGGGGREGGGGGAGGFRTNYPSPDTGGTPVTAQTYPITVGAGAAGATTTSPGSTGSNSVFSTITSAGGGGGGSKSGPNAGQDGGSGGGNGRDAGNGTGGSGNTPPVSPPQGNDGGGVPGTSAYDGGGGGGAGTAGSAGGTNVGGTGGNGTASSITGSSVTRAAGGGGGADNPGDAATGGTGGGGNGGSPDQGGPVAGTAGTSNTGSGGGGGGSPAPQGSGGAGGSGIVIIRYKYQ